MPDHKLRRIFFGCVGVATLTYLWGVTLSPGVIVNGSFCVMVPKSPDAVDARSFANFLGVATLVCSVVLYVKSYRHLKRLRKKYVRGGGRMPDWACRTVDTIERPTDRPTD